MISAISRWLLTAEGPVQSLASIRGICGRQSGIETGFSPAHCGFPRQYHSSSVLLSVTYHRPHKILVIYSGIKQKIKKFTLYHAMTSQKWDLGRALLFL